MRIVRRPVRLASPRRKNKCDVGLDFGTTGTFPHRDAGGTMATTSGAIWMRHVADLIRLNEPRDRRAQTTQHTSPMTTAHTTDYRPTNTHPSPNLRPSSTKITGWATATTAAHFNLQLAHLRWKITLNTSTDRTPLLHDQTKLPLTHPMRHRPQQTPPMSRSVLPRGAAKNDTRFDPPLTWRMALRSVLFSSQLVYVKSS